MFLSISFLFIILILNLIIGLKHIRLWRKITVRYPKLENKMLAFRPYKNPYGFIPILHKEYFFPIIRRYLLLESFSKTKTEKFYKEFYRTDLVKEIKDKEINKNLKLILKASPVRDILTSVFFVLFIIMFIIGIYYSFSQ